MGTASTELEIRHKKLTKKVMYFAKNILNTDSSLVKFRKWHRVYFYIRIFFKGFFIITKNKFP